MAECGDGLGDGGGINVLEDVLVGHWIHRSFYAVGPSSFPKWIQTAAKNNPQATLQSRIRHSCCRRCCRCCCRCCHSLRRPSIRRLKHSIPAETTMEHEPINQPTDQLTYHLTNCMTDRPRSSKKQKKIKKKKI